MSRFTDYIESLTNIADAITKKHTQNTDTDLNATFEATLLKKTELVFYENELFSNNNVVVTN